MTLPGRDKRPKTLVLQHDLGIGDLVFRLPYIRAIAMQSENDKVTLIARPTCRAPDLLRAESCIETIIHYDRWRKDDNKGRHRGFWGHWQLTREIRDGRFERIVIFSDRVRYGLLAVLAGIPIRIGYGGFGFSWLQRLFLNKKPFIKPYKGPCNSNYQLGTALAIAHGFVEGPQVPRLNMPQDIKECLGGKTERFAEKTICFRCRSLRQSKGIGGVRTLQRLPNSFFVKALAVICLGGKARRDFA